MAIKEGDFIEIDYTARLEGGETFDTTQESVARAEGLYEEGRAFGPVIVCLGQGFVLEGLEKALIGKELGSHVVLLTAEQGFGKKSAKLVQLVPTAKLRKQQVMPVPGMQLNIDGAMGVVKTVTGGRTVVDFNHPLAGKALRYNVTIVRTVTDQKEKADAVLRFYFKLPATTSYVDGTLTITSPLPKELEPLVAERVKLLASINKVAFGLGQ